MKELCEMYVIKALVSTLNFPQYHQIQSPNRSQSSCMQQEASLSLYILISQFLKVHDDVVT